MNENTGEKIYRLRTMLGWSRRELKERTGYSIQAIYNWEKGRKEPSAPVIKAMRKTFGPLWNGSS